MSAIMPHHTTSSTPSLLTRVLQLDAWTGFAMGLALVLGHAPLGPLLGLPPEFLLAAGLVLMPFVALLWRAGRAGPVVLALVWTVLLVNAAWVVLSLLCAFVWLTPTPLGQAFLLVQALAVLVLAVLEYLGLRQLGRAA